jgi:hypothetical protein
MRHTQWHRITLPNQHAMSLLAGRPLAVAYAHYYITARGKAKF